MEQKVLNATLKSNGKKVQVYKSKLRDTYIDYSNCTTEYKPSDLNIEK